MSKKRYLSPFEINEFPIPERDTEFHEEDFRENIRDEFLNNLILHDCDIEDMDEEKSYSDPLILTDGNLLYRIAEEYPIVVYRCSEKAEVRPLKFLNTFIESITVSTANEGTAI